MLPLHPLITLAYADGQCISGVTRESAWCYNGIFGLAGLHIEDGNLSFIHTSLWLEMETDSLVDLEQEVMCLALKLCGHKVWVFAPSR